MKLSRYNLIRNINEKTMLFNTKKCLLAEMDENSLGLMTKLEQGIENFEISDVESEILLIMKDNGVVVENTVDEIQELKMEHLSAKYSIDFLDLTIAPTLDCNFGCPYCYQTCEQVLMTDEIQENIVKLGRV